MPTSVPPRIGFIGFGEVAAVLSRALGQHGVEVLAYDAVLDRADGPALLRGRDGTGRVGFGPLAEMIGRVDCVLSTVTTTVAVAAARSAAIHLGRGKVYVDLNAASPAIKREVAGIITATGADFAEEVIAAVSRGLDSKSAQSNP